MNKQIWDIHSVYTVYIIHTTVSFFLKARCSGGVGITSPKAAREDSSCLGASSLYTERVRSSLYTERLWTNPLYIIHRETLDQSTIHYTQRDFRPTHSLIFIWLSGFGLDSTLIHDTFCVLGQHCWLGPMQCFRALIAELFSGKYLQLKASFKTGYFKYCMCIVEKSLAVSSFRRCQPSLPPVSLCDWVASSTTFKSVTFPILWKREPNQQLYLNMKPSVILLTKGRRVRSSYELCYFCWIVLSFVELG